MKYTMLTSLAISLLIPPVLIAAEKCMGMRSGAKRALLALDVLAMLYFTIFRLRHADPPYIDLTPFWSYARFDQADIRWQVYMNVFLFIPFGFMLPWCSEWLQRLWKVLLISAIFAALTEAAQYILRIGLCETDDVIHNTLGAVIGYGYWRLLGALQMHFRRRKE